jgi:CheY-like chemotaxis protein
MKKVLFIGFTPLQAGLARKFLIFRNLATEIEIVGEQQSSAGVVGYVVNGDDPSSQGTLALNLRLNPRPALGIGGVAVQGITAFLAGPFKPATADRLAELLRGKAGGLTDKPAHASKPLPEPEQEPTGNVLAFPGTVTPQEATVLVVDDSEIVQRTMVRKITEYGQRVDVASNGKDALAMLQGTAYKLIFLDILMPGMDGFEVCKKIKKSAEFKSSAVYMLSSKDGMFDKVRGSLAGCNGYLVKPLEVRKLREVLDRHFERPSEFRDSAFPESRIFADSRMADSRFQPSRPPAPAPAPAPAVRAPAAAKPAKPASAASAAARQGAPSQFDNERLLEPYRAEISNAFAPTQPARLEDMPDYKPPNKGRGG